MRSKLWLALVLGLVAYSGPALGAGPSGSTECHVKDDDCDGAIDEDTGTLAIEDNDGDGSIDEDSPDGVDDDADGVEGEDPGDDDGDGAVNEDPEGNATTGDGGNQVDCNEDSSTDVGGVAYVYAGTNGAEVCADDSSAAPIDGRATASEDGYVAIDGDESNPAPGNGYVRLDEEGPHCGNESNQDSTAADQSGNTSGDCG
jgi:hypothetical protein